MPSKQTSIQRNGKWFTTCARCGEPAKQYKAIHDICNVYCSKCVESLARANEADKQLKLY